MRNPYTVLGVAKTADEKQIKSAFRKLAMRFHPDHNKDDAGAQEKFAEINQAYEILGDKEKRAAFDRGEIDAEGKPAFQGGFGGQGGFGSHGGGHAGGSPFGNFDFASGAGAGGFNGNIHIDESLFSDIFGRGGFGRQAGSHGRRRQSPQQRGADVSAELALPLEQIIGGEKVDVSFSDGKRLKIKLPLYLEDGQTIRLKGQGAPGLRGGPAGDALITIRFKPDTRFRLDGRIVHMDMPVSLKTAVLGGKETLKTPEGAVAVAVPAWSSSDKILRLKDKGLPLKEGGRAPLYVHIRLMLPAEPDKKLKEMMENYPA